MSRRVCTVRQYCTALQQAPCDNASWMVLALRATMRPRMSWVRAYEEHAFRRAFGSVGDVTSTGVVHTRCEKKRVHIRIHKTLTWKLRRRNHGRCETNKTRS